MPAKRLYRTLKNRHSRAVFILYGGAAFHFFYALFRIGSGILYRRYRVDVVAFYYLLLAFNRLFLIRAHRRRTDHALCERAVRISGRLLFLTVGFLLLLIAQTAAGARQSEGPRYFAVVSGAYAFLCAALAVYELTYAGRVRAPLLVASRTVSLAATLLSGFTFFCDILFSLGHLLSDPFRTVLLLSVGAAAVLLLLVLSVWLLRTGQIK